MPEVLTETDEEQLLLLYNAACRADQLFTQGRSFEEWREKVSDHGLAAARCALEAEIDAERARLERAIVNEVMKEDRKGMLTPWIAEARKALIDFESSQQQIKKTITIEE